MKELFYITIYTAAALVVLTFLANKLYKLKESNRVFRNLAIFIYNYSYLILIGIGVSFMVFDEIYNTNGEYINRKLSDILYGICKAIFSIGAFSGAIKFASTLKLFKEQYKKIIMSDEFNNLLGTKLDAFAHSTEYLEKLDLHQLKELWQDVTLSKYKNSFPSIYDELKNNLENELFLKANTNFYYKHFYVEYDIELVKEDDKFIKVTYSTNYTIIRNTEKEFEWSFSKTAHKNSHESSELETLISIDGDEVFNSKLAKYDVEKENLSKHKAEDSDEVSMKCTEILKGRKQYHVKKISTYKQNLEVDKTLGFGSGRIIDDLFVTIKYSEGLDVFFSKVNKNIFDKKEDKEIRILKYENRNLLLPGEKFRIFLLRPGK